MEDCKEHSVKINDINLSWFEWGQKKATEATYLLVHATGFHARCWDQVVKSLGDHHVIAIDLRGHGRSDNTGPFTWDYFAADLAAFIEVLDLNQIVASGHSMGGHSITQAAARVPKRFERLVLVDPVILAPELYEQQNNINKAWLNEAGEHPVARRKNHFSDAREMFDNFKDKGSYGLWDKKVLMDYCEYGLVPDLDGPGFVLACPPKVEASIYMGSSARNIYDEVKRVDVPVKVLRAAQRDADRQEMDFSKSPTWEGLAGCFPQGTDVYLPDLTHFIPMQAPELTAQHILDHSLTT